jgi:hypothetical protein
MNSHEDAQGEPEALDAEEEETDKAFTGGGGPASVIYGDGDRDDDEADEIADSMLKAPDEST